MNHLLSRGAPVLLAVALVFPTADALTINRNFISAGNSFGSGAGTAANAPSLAGTGDLISVFNAAADAWEAVINDEHTVNINFGWQSLGTGILGVHSLTGQGGTPHRETSAVIRFSTNFNNWFADGTPHDHSEYTTYTQYDNLWDTNAGPQLVNEGKVYTGATGAAAGRFDLLTVAVHEIGHALGLSSANLAFQNARDINNNITVDFGQYDGLVIPTVSGAHINCPNCNMYPSVSHSRRNLISDMDILANATISQFRDLNLTNAVPEPATMTILGLGALALLRRKRKA